MRRAARVDENQAEIIRALERIGASVIDCSGLGKGVPDLIVGFRGRNHLMEVKNRNTSYGQKGLNDKQKLWSLTWRGEVHVVHTVDEAIGVLARFS